MERQHNILKILKTWPVITLIILFCLGLIFDFTPLGGGNMQTYGKAITCLRWPVHGLYVKRKGSYYPAPPFKLMLQSSIERFCTEQEAENAGYSADEFEESYKDRFNRANKNQ